MNASLLINALQFASELFHSSLQFLLATFVVSFAVLTSVCRKAVLVSQT